MPINYEALANLIEELGREGRAAKEGLVDYLRNTGREENDHIFEGFVQLRDAADDLGIA